MSTLAFIEQGCLKTNNRKSNNSNSNSTNFEIMFTRKKLRQILEVHQQEFKSDYFKKLKTLKDQDHNQYQYQYDKDSLQTESSVLKKNELSKTTTTATTTTTPATATKASTKPKIVSFLKAHCLNLKAKATSSMTSASIQKDYANVDTFHRAVRPIFLIAQCFATMPIIGIWKTNPFHMRFSCQSIQMLVTLIFFCSNALLFATMLKHLMNIGINAKNIVGLAFFSSAQVASGMFVVIARRWPTLIQNWTRVELIFTQLPYEDLKRNLKSRVQLAAYTLLGLAMLEHALSVISAVLSYNRRVHICAEARNVSVEISFDEYISQNYDYVFSLLSYRTTTGIFILVVNGMSTFIWNYMDIFIMMVSKGIAYRFEQIMMRIKKIANQNVSERTFIEIRTHYVQVCELLDNVDENLSGIILLSCINNLYFVCYQLLNIFNKLRWPINHIYFWYSLLYLIGRTAFVFLTAASINDESKSALSALRSVSHRTYCVEVERLIFQMTTQTVALSGKKFYFMTRRLLFGMAGTIVTYELVLLQFDEPNRSKGLPPLCG